MAPSAISSLSANTTRKSGSCSRNSFMTFSASSLELSPVCCATISQSEYLSSIVWYPCALISCSSEPMDSWIAAILMVMSSSVCSSSVESVSSFAVELLFIILSKMDALLSVAFELSVFTSVSSLSVCSDSSWVGASEAAFSFSAFFSSSSFRYSSNHFPAFFICFP